MDLNENLVLFEDPAPSRKRSNSSIAGVKPSTRLTLKRRLRYRPDVEVTGSRYKGRRVSRADVDLDRQAIGLFDDDDDDGDPVSNHNPISGVDGKLNPGPDGESDSLGSSASGDIVSMDQDSDESEEDDGDVGKDSSLKDNGHRSDEPSSDVSSSDDDDGPSGKASRRDGIALSSLNVKEPHRRNSGQLSIHQRSFIERLHSTRKDDEDRATAVRSQKDMYDAAVNLRIRLEPLMNIARSFPTQVQRNAASSWNSSEKLKSAEQDAESALSTLLGHLNSVFRNSWPCRKSGGTDSDFDLWRDSTLDLWGRKVSDASGVVPKGGFKAFDTSVTAQMRATLSTGKILNRTREVKQPILLVGGIELPSGHHEFQYDDSEFYRTLLRDIIESGDAPGGGLRYAQLSKEGRTRKKRDLSMVKGKRINYQVHEKMVGFLPPVPLPDPGPLDEILTNLFGKGTHVVDQN